MSGQKTRSRRRPRKQAALAATTLAPKAAKAAALQAAAEFVKVDGKLIAANFMTKLLNRVEFDQEYKRLAYIPEGQEDPPAGEDAVPESLETSEQV